MVPTCFRPIIKYVVAYLVIICLQTAMVKMGGGEGGQEIQLLKKQLKKDVILLPSLGIFY